MESPLAISVRSHASTKAISFAVLAISLLCAGCHNGKRLQADLYQRELRLQEDKIYQLQDCVEEYQAIIRGYRCEVSDLKSGIVSDFSSTNGGHSGSQKPLALIEPLNGKPTSAKVKFRSPQEAPTVADESPAFEGKAPEFNSLFDEESGSEILPLPTKAADEAPLFVPQSYDEEANQSPLQVISAIDLQTEPTNERVAEMPTVEPLPIKQLVYAKRTESEFELRNGSPEPTGEATLLATLRLFSEIDLETFNGELAFLLTDTQTPGPSTQIARWDFTAAEVRQAWGMQHHTEGNKVVELPLLLPESLPTDRSLEMWVRVVEASGKKQLMKIDAEFLPNPIRLINIEPLAKTDTPQQPTDRTVEWRRARADRMLPLESESPVVLQASYEEVVE